MGAAGGFEPWSVLRPNWNSPDRSSRGLPKGRNAIGLVAACSQSVVALDAIFSSSLASSDDNARRRSRLIMSRWFWGGANGRSSVLPVVSTASWIRAFSAAARAMSASSPPISASRASRSFLFVASGLGGGGTLRAALVFSPLRRVLAGMLLPVSFNASGLPFPLAAAPADDGGRSGGCLRGELLLLDTLSAARRADRRRLLGVLLWCRPGGDVVSSGSGCSGVGGSSGSGGGACSSGGRKRSRPDRRSCLSRATSGSRRSSRRWGSGGGNGRGTGLMGDRRGGSPSRLLTWLLATALPKRRRVGDRDGERDDLGPADVARDGDRIGGCASGRTAEGRAGEERTGERMGGRARGRTFSNAVSVARSLSELLWPSCASSMASSVSLSAPLSSLVAAWRRSRIAGLCRARLARVGEAKDGGRGRGILDGVWARESVVPAGSRSGGVVVDGIIVAKALLLSEAAALSRAAAKRGEVLRLFPGGDSIVRLRASAAPHLEACRHARVSQCSCLFGVVAMVHW